MKKILFFDTETAGLPYNYNAPITDSNNWPRLVQLGWIVCNINGETIKEQNYIIYPNDFTIPQEAVEVHGITTQKAINEGCNLTIVLNNELTLDTLYLVVKYIEYLVIDIILYSNLSPKNNIIVPIKYKIIIFLSNFILDIKYNGININAVS